MIPPPPSSTLFPYTTLFRSILEHLLDRVVMIERIVGGPLRRQRHHVGGNRSEEHTSELQSRPHLVCRLLLEKKKGTLGSASFKWSRDNGSVVTRVLEAVNGF